MRQKPIFLTREGRAKIEAELQHLREVRRPEVAARIRAAKEGSDAMDNPEFDEAKNEQAFVEGRILTLERLIAQAVIIEAEPAHDVVRLGARVTVVDQEGEHQQFTLVGSAEVDPRQGKISNESPVGKALIGRRAGDEVEVLTPGGAMRFTVLAVD